MSLRFLNPTESSAFIHHLLLVTVVPTSISDPSFQSTVHKYHSYSSSYAITLPCATLRTLERNIEDMSEGGEGHRPRRRLHQHHLTDPNFSHHQDYVGPRDRQRASRSPSKSPGVSPPGRFDELYDDTMADRAPTSSPASEHPSSAYQLSPTSKDKTTNPKAQHTSSSPTKPQTSNTSTAANSQVPQLVKWSSTVRPPPYDPARMPRPGDPYSDEENYHIAWGVVDGLNISTLSSILPNRHRGSGVGQHWYTALQHRSEFAWVKPKARERAEAELYEKGNRIYQEKAEKKKRRDEEKKRLREETRQKEISDRAERKQEDRRKLEARKQKKEERKGEDKGEIEERKRKQEEEMLERLVRMRRD